MAEAARIWNGRIKALGPGLAENRSGSIKNSFGRALMFQGATEESLKWRGQARYAVGRAYGHDHPRTLDNFSILQRL